MPWMKAAGVGLGLPLIVWASFNVGFEYGVDTGTCVTFAITTKTPADENEFCQRVQPESTPVRRALRMSWLAATGDLP